MAQVNIGGYVLVGSIVDYSTAHCYPPPVIMTEGRARYDTDNTECQIGIVTISIYRTRYVETFRSSTDHPHSSWIAGSVAVARVGGW